MLSHLGRIARTRGQLEEAEKYFKDALEIARDKSVRDRQCEGACLGYLGRIALTRAQEEPKDSVTAHYYLEDARKHFEESRQLAEAIMDERGVSISMSQLGRLAFEKGQLKEASRLFRQSLL